MTYSTSLFTLSTLFTFSRNISANTQAKDETKVRHVTKNRSVHSACFTSLYSLSTYGAYCAPSSQFLNVSNTKRKSAKLQMKVMIHIGHLLGQLLTNLSNEARPVHVHHLSKVHIDAQRHSQLEKYKLYCSLPSPPGPLIVVLNHTDIHQKNVKKSSIHNSTLP